MRTTGNRWSGGGFQSGPGSYNYVRAVTYLVLIKARSTLRSTFGTARFGYRLRVSRYITKNRRSLKIQRHALYSVFMRTGPGNAPPAVTGPALIKAIHFWKPLGVISTRWAVCAINPLGSLSRSTQPQSKRKKPARLQLSQKSSPEIATDCFSEGSHTARSSVIEGQCRPCKLRKERTLPLCVEVAARSALDQQKCSDALQNEQSDVILNSWLSHGGCLRAGFPAAAHCVSVLRLSGVGCNSTWLLQC